MNFEVIFNAQVDPALIEQVFIGHDLVPSSGGKTAVIEDYSTHGNMLVTFRISGPNGTDFTITYSCTSDGVATEDKSQPSIVKSSIVRGGEKQIILKIPV